MGCALIFIVGAYLGGAKAVASDSAGLEAQLRENLETARWMQDYDKVASETTDLLLKESKETLKEVTAVWFCMQKDRVWYAVYGTNRFGTFDIAVCYKQVSKDTFEKVGAPSFPDKDRFARAISLTLPEILDTTRRTTVRFNYFIRSRQDRIELYYVPAIQPDGLLAFGIQHSFLINSTGEELTSHRQYGKILVGAIPFKNRTVTLEMTQCPVPTPQAIFTMMSYRDQFADIVTHCQDGYFGVASQNGAITCVQKEAPPPDQRMIPGLTGLPTAAPRNGKN